MNREQIIAMAKQAWLDHARPWAREFWPWWVAQLMAESGLNPDAVSPVGALGVAQMMPKTGQSLGYSREQLLDPTVGVVAGARYMAQIMLYGHAPPRRLKPETRRDAVEIAAMAYNAGPGWIYLLSNKGRKCVVGILVERGQPLTVENAMLVLPEVTGHHATETIDYIKRIREFERSLI